MASREGPNDYGWTDSREARATEREIPWWRMLESTIATYDDQPDECTLHPPEPTDSERTTAWVTAKQGAYVSAVAWR